MDLFRIFNNLGIYQRVRPSIENLMVSNFFPFRSLPIFVSSNQVEQKMIAPLWSLPKFHALHFNIGSDSQSTTYKWGDKINKLTKKFHKVYSVIKQPIVYPHHNKTQKIE